MKYFSALQLMPHLKNQEYGNQLAARFLKSNEYQQERILENAKLLDSAPQLNEFHFPKTSTNETKDLLLFEGYGDAEKMTLLPSGEFKNKKIKIPQLKATDKQGRFEFIIEHKEDCAFITICKVTLKHRGKGYFYLMAQGIRDYCFNELKVNTIVGNARPPRTESGPDWRTELVTYRNNFTNGKPVQLTRLHVLWLNEPLALHGKILGSDDAESFCFLNPDKLAQFTADEFAEWDRICPKKNTRNSFTSLLKGKEVV